MYFPLRRYDVCNQKRNFQSIVALSLFAIGFYSYGFWTTSIQSLSAKTKMCMTLDHWISLFKIMSIFDMILTMFVPCVLIFALNALIICKLAKKKNLSIKQSRGVKPAKTTEFSCISETSFTNAAQGEGTGAGTADDKSRIAGTDSDSHDESPSERKRFIPAPSQQPATSTASSTGRKGNSRTLFRTPRSANHSASTATTGSTMRTRKNACLPNSTMKSLDYKSRVVRLLSNSSAGRKAQLGSKHRRQYSKTTRMLLMISATFLLLHGPTAILKLYYILSYVLRSSSAAIAATNGTGTGTAAEASHSSMAILETNTWEELVERITSYIYYLHYSLNFFLYVFNLKKFRFVFFKCLKR